MGKLINYFKEHFSDSVLDFHEQCGDETIVVTRDKLIEVLSFAKNDLNTQFNFLMDVCGVDYLGQEPRFEVVYHLYSLVKNHRLRIKVRVPEKEAWVPTSISLWPSADWFERETWDMLGIEFKGHPNLKRLLLFEGFEGHPLRKDYEINKRQKIPEALAKL